MDPSHSTQRSGDGQGYEPDLTDAEWAVIEPLRPARQETT
jgi:hypothetical protein